MKILIIHNHYRSSAPSGEDTVVRNESELLRSNGYEVEFFKRFNDDIDESKPLNRVALAIDTTWSRASKKSLAAAIRRFRPEVVHVHNIFPQISPSAYAACREAGVPVVQTLHNYRFICANALLTRNSAPCEECVGRLPWPALRHRCYRDSLGPTAAIVAMQTINRLRGVYRNLVDCYIALTRFSADRFIAGGLPRERVVVKPNFIPDLPPVGSGAGGFVVYVGRLSAEKGVRTLLRAWGECRAIPLKILGEGPLRAELTEYARSRALPVEFLGYCSREQVLATVGDAIFSVIPSECYEGFPLVVLESLACGTPVLASNIGSLGEIVQPAFGKTFESGRAESLSAAVQLLAQDSNLRGTMRREAREVLTSRYSARTNLSQLSHIYAEVVARNPNRSARSETNPSCQSR